MELLPASWNVSADMDLLLASLVKMNWCMTTTGQCRLQGRSTTSLWYAQRLSDVTISLMVEIRKQDSRTISLGKMVGEGAGHGSAEYVHCNCFVLTFLTCINNK